MVQKTFQENILMDSKDVIIALYFIRVLVLIVRVVTSNAGQQEGLTSQRQRQLQHIVSSITLIQRLSKVQLKWISRTILISGINYLLTEKIDDVTYIVNNYQVFNSWRKGMWLCECRDWIYNKQMGELGDCKHIKAVIKKEQ